MAVTVFKTFSSGETLTASDLNSSLTQFTDNGEDFGTPWTKAHDANGNEFVLDSDGDTSITADSDDIIHFRLQGNDLFILNGATASVVNGLQMTASIANGDVILVTQGSDTNIDLDIQAKGSGTVLVDGAVINKAGKQTIWVPAAAMRPTVSNGCSSLTDVETTSARPDMTVLDFATAADDFAQFQIAMPKSWNLGTVTAQFFWTKADTDTGGVTWAIKGVGMPDDGTIDVAFGTQVDVDDAGHDVAEDLHVSGETPAMTIAGTPADDDMTYFHVSRDVSDTNDSYAADARLIGVKLFITTDIANDD